jgi:cell division protein ZapA
MDTTVQVEINNQIYNLRANDGDTEHIQKLAAMVDARMREIKQSGPTVDSLKVAILAALHIADDLERMKAEHELLNQKLVDLSNECAQALDEVLKPKS